MLNLLWTVKLISALYSYDSHGVFSSPRALLMFRAFGHENSSILAVGRASRTTRAVGLVDGSAFELATISS